MLCGPTLPFEGVVYRCAFLQCYGVLVGILGACIVDFVCTCWFTLRYNVVSFIDSPCNKRAFESHVNWVGWYHGLCTTPVQSKHCGIIPLKAFSCSVMVGLYKGTRLCASFQFVIP